MENPTIKKRSMGFHQQIQGLAQDIHGIGGPLNEILDVFRNHQWIEPMTIDHWFWGHDQYNFQKISITIEGTWSFHWLILLQKNITFPLLIQNSKTIGFHIKP